MYKKATRQSETQAIDGHKGTWALKQILLWFECWNHNLKDDFKFIAFMLTYRHSLFSLTNLKQIKSSLLRSWSPDAWARAKVLSVWLACMLHIHQWWIGLQILWWLVTIFVWYSVAWTVNFNLATPVHRESGWLATMPRRRPGGWNLPCGWTFSVPAVV